MTHRNLLTLIFENYIKFPNFLCIACLLSKMFHFRPISALIPWTNYRMSPTVVGRIIDETCQVIWTTLIAKGFIKHHINGGRMEKIADEFNNRAIGIFLQT